MKRIKLNTQITSIRSRADGSLGVSFVTPELTSSEKAEFMELHNQNVLMELNPVEYQNVDEIQVDNEAGGKTPSQRLRNTLYVYWQSKGSKGDFELFYKKKMENLINIIKEKLV